MSSILRNMVRKAARESKRLETIRKHKEDKETVRKHLAEQAKIIASMKDTASKQFQPDLLFVPSAVNAVPTEPLGEENFPSSSPGYGLRYA